MADIRPSRFAQDQRATKWAIILPLAVIASLIFSIVFFNALYGRPNYEVGLYDAAHPVAMVTHRGSAWQTVGQPMQVPDEEMVAIATTDQGFLLYTLRGGGAGAGPELGLEPSAYSELWLRTTEGMYQAVQPGRPDDAPVR